MVRRGQPSFLITEFYSNGLDVAISQGANPVTSGWFIYRFPTSSFPDYPKFSVWSDGYYITANKNSGTAGTSQVVFVLNRAKMLVGNPSPTMQGFPLTGIITSGFYSPLAFNANGTTPPFPGNVPVVYMQDDSWAAVASDHIKLWTINVNWTTPASSTISSPQIIPTQPFDGLFDGRSFTNLPQPAGGADVDVLQTTIMYMAQYRRFPTYNTAIFNFVVDLNGADNYSGIRWYELRQPTDGAPWTIYQEGTYSAPGGRSAWCGNMCMDQNGSIGLAYTVVNTSTFPSLRFTGRRASDPLGTMTLTEDVIANGTQVDPHSRYGDYAQMTIDPVDDATFWSIGEYFKGGRKNQVGVFQIVPLSPIAQFSASPTIVTVNQTVTFTDLSSNTPTSWVWSFSPNIIAYVGGTNANSQNPQVQFTTAGPYIVTLVATNFFGTDSEIKTNYINVIPYCIPAYTTGTGAGDYISLVQLGSINNATGASSSPYYTYYSSLSADLARASSNTITLSAGSYFAYNNISVWIDFNQNGVFETSEKLGNVELAAAPATGIITFTAPLAAALGTTRMRVREVYSDGNFDPCNLAYYGETEDYDINIINTNKVLNLTVFLEGLYAGSGIMNKASNGSDPQYSGSIADQISVELHNSSSYPYIEFNATNVNLNTNGSAVVVVPGSFTGSYYVTIRHRNSIETTTAVPVSFLAPMLSYAFNNQAKAYGGNLLQTNDGRFVIYSGDVDQDGLIDSSDLISADNDVSTFTTGYIATDINGDGLVDSSDMIVIDNNSGTFVGTMHP